MVGHPGSLTRFLPYRLEQAETIFKYNKQTLNSSIRWNVVKVFVQVL